MASRNFQSLLLKQNPWKSISLIENRSVSSTSKLAGGPQPPAQDIAEAQELAGNSSWAPSKPGVETFVPIILLSACGLWLGNQVRETFAHDASHDH